MFYPDKDIFMDKNATPKKQFGLKDAPDAGTQFNATKPAPMQGLPPSKVPPARNPKTGTLCMWCPEL